MQTKTCSINYLDDANGTRTTGSYVGRFAPSPSGPLHFGSLVCALASFLDAKANNGTWLVRIEDLDPPREQVGATSLILESLAKHALHWDREITYQSQRTQRYDDTLVQLAERSLSYPCDCTRQRLAKLGGVYDGHCRTRSDTQHLPTAIRLNTNLSLAQTPALSNPICFIDAAQGKQQYDLFALGDYIIHRKDGLHAYQLAVVVDDIAQGVTHVVRGTDLLDTTANQILLFNLLSDTAPLYSHIPVIVNIDGRKLSKQNHAPAIKNDKASENMYLALQALGLNPTLDLRDKSPESLLNWAIPRWQVGAVMKGVAMSYPLL